MGERRPPRGAPGEPQPGRGPATDGPVLRRPGAGAAPDGATATARAVGQDRRITRRVGRLGAYPDPSGVTGAIHRNGPRHPLRPQGAPAGDRGGNPHCGLRGHRGAPGAVGGARRVGLRRLRAGALPGRTAGHQAGSRGGTGRRRRAGAGRTGLLPVGPMARRGAAPAGPRRPDRLGRASPDPHGLPAGPGQAEEGGGPLDPAAAELAGARRAGRRPDRGRGLAGRRRRPAGRHRHAGHRRGDQGAAQPVEPAHPAVVSPGRPVRAGRRCPPGPRAVRARAAGGPRGLRRGRPPGGTGSGAPTPLEPPRSSSSRSSSSHGGTTRSSRANRPGPKGVTKPDPPR